MLLEAGVGINQLGHTRYVLVRELGHVEAVAAERLRERHLRLRPDSGLQQISHRSAGRAGSGCQAARPQWTLIQEHIQRHGAGFSRPGGLPGLSHETAPARESPPPDTRNTSAIPAHNVPGGSLRSGERALHADDGGGPSPPGRVSKRRTAWTRCGASSERSTAPCSCRPLPSARVELPGIASMPPAAPGLD